MARLSPKRRIPALLLLLLLLPASDIVAAELDAILNILRSIPAPEDVLETARARASDRGGSEDGSGEDPGKVHQTPSFFLRNGTILRGELAEASLPVETPYGILGVPVDRLVNVRFSLRTPPDVTRRIALAVAALGDNDFEVRENASRDLVELGLDAILPLRNALKSPDEEVRKRAETVLDELADLVAKENSDTIPSLGTLDHIETLDASFEGVVQVTTLTVRTAHGELRVPRQELVRARFGHRGPRGADITVPATAGIPTNWLSTPISVKRGERLRISASGRMTVPDYGYFSGPDGGGRRSRTFPGLNELTLVGRIGKGGNIFLVGSRFRARATRPGRLYLGIVPFRYSHHRVGGEYTVEISAR